MPVTDPSAGFIFCEGKKSNEEKDDYSYDYLLLNGLLNASGPQIVPTGGKHGLKSFIDGYLSTYKSTPPYIGFRDRDFDIKPPKDPQLIRLLGGKPIWTTYCACIENYVIDPDLIAAGWTKVGADRQVGNLPSRDVLQEIIVNSAHEISDYQAVRWSLAGLKPGDRWPEINTTWLNGSGEIPDKLDFENCIENARGLVDIYLKKTKTVSVEKLENVAESYRKQFSAAEFYDSAHYLVWFHGKDLLKVVCRNLGAQFPYKSYMRWAVENISINAHPDFIDLKNLCNNLQEQ
ncbi:MAG: hypothetical protein WA821_12385 [Anaerolineales bacterium]